MSVFLYHHEGPNKHRLTQPGVKLYKDAMDLIRPLFMEYCRVGFSAPEIASVMANAVGAIETEGALELTEG
jgi:hypothetical protein